MTIHYKSKTLSLNRNQTTETNHFLLGLGVYGNLCTQVGYAIHGRVAGYPDHRCSQDSPSLWTFNLASKWPFIFFLSCICRLGNTDMSPFCAYMKSTWRKSDKWRFMKWNSEFFLWWFQLICWFCSKNLLYSMPSQNVSWLVGLKMALKCRALICFYIVLGLNLTRISTSPGGCTHIPDRAFEAFYPSFSQPPQKESFNW